MKKTEIIPGKGFNDVLLGMSMDQVKAVLGEPDDISNLDYDDGETAKTLNYDDLGLSLTFESAEDFKLSFMSFDTADYILSDKIHVGMTKEKVLDLCDEIGFAYVEDKTEDELEDECIMVETENINFWFEEGVLEEIEIGPFWADNDTPIWG